MYRTDKQLEEITDSTRFEREGEPTSAWNLLRRLTIDATPEQLHRFYRDPKHLAMIHGHFAQITPISNTRTHWQVQVPLGLALQWDSEITEDVPGEKIAWRSTEGASVPNEGWVRFDKAPADWGTEVTIYTRFDPPGGPLGDAALAMSTAVPKIIADKALRRFKSLVETGEIATTATQPAARGQGRDKK